MYEGNMEPRLQRQSNVGDGELEWQEWPAADRPSLSIAIGIAAIVISTATALSYGNALYGTAALLILFLATTKHYLPTIYRIDADSVTAKTPFSTTRKPWEAFATFFEDDSGIFLSPRSKLTWTAYQRGIYLRCPKIKDAVRQHVQQRLKRRAED